MAGRPPPPINVTNLKVGDMIGLGPTPSWLYTNAIKIGITKVAIPYTDPVQYYQYDTLEYIHPTWDSSIDYSKPQMPTRVWYEGKLYTPGTWLTSSKKGQAPNVVECLVGDARFRAGMNFPPDNSEYKPTNQSHPFRIWKPFTKKPENATAYLSEVDEPFLPTVPVCLADELGHYTSTNTVTGTHFCPTPNEPYKVKITTQGGNSFAEPEDAIIDVDPKTGVISTRGYININHEAPFSYGINNDYDGLQGGAYFNSWTWFTGIASYGVSLGDLYSQSTISTQTTTVTGTTSAGANIYSTQYSMTTGSGAPVTQCFIVTSSLGGAGYFNWYFNYGIYGGDYFSTRAKESMYDSDGLYKPIISSSGTPGNNYYKREGLFNIFREITHPLFFTRTSVAHQMVDKETGSARTIGFPPGPNGVTPPPIYQDTYFRSGSGRDIPVPAQMKSIAIGGSTGKPGQFKNGTYYCDANAVGQFSITEENRYSSTFSQYSSFSQYSRETSGPAYFYKYQDHG